MILFLQEYIALNLSFCNSNDRSLFDWGVLITQVANKECFHAGLHISCVGFYLSKIWKLIGASVAGVRRISGLPTKRLETVIFEKRHDCWLKTYVVKHHSYMQARGLRRLLQSAYNHQFCYFCVTCMHSQPERLMSNISRDLRKWAIQKGNYTSCSLKKWKGGCWKMA